MSNLNNNTTQLEALLAKVNALPEAGAGGSDPVLQAKTVTPTKAQQNVAPDDGYDGLSQVTVNAIPDTYIQPSGTLEVTANGTHNVENYASVNVNVPSSGGGGGGESVETCAVTVQLIAPPMQGVFPSCLIYTAVEDGKILNKVIHEDELDLEWTKDEGTASTGKASFTINCVVGTSVYFGDENMVCGSFVASDNITLKGVVDLLEVFQEAVINSGPTGIIEAVL